MPSVGHAGTRPLSWGRGRPPGRPLLPLVILEKPACNPDQISRLKPTGRPRPQLWFAKGRPGPHSGE